MISLECAVLDTLLDKATEEVKEAFSVVAELDNIARDNAAVANSMINRLHRKAGYALGLLEAAEALNYSDREKCDKLREIIFNYDALNAMVNDYPGQL